MWTKCLRSWWGTVRSAILPKRLYRYGTVGLRFFDDRTTLEKLFDAIDAQIDRLYDKQAWIEARKTWHWKKDWVDGLGNSREQIAASEAKGYAYASEREWDQHAAKSRRDNEAKSDKRFRERVNQRVAEIKQGRKFNTPEMWANAAKRLNAR